MRDTAEMLIGEVVSRVDVAAEKLRRMLEASMDGRMSMQLGRAERHVIEAWIIEERERTRQAVDAWACRWVSSPDAYAELTSIIRSGGRRQTSR